VSVLFIVLPLALVVVLAAVIAFLWAARRGQFDDLTTPAIRALHEDEPSPTKPDAGAQPSGAGRPRREAPGGEPPAGS
jgi:cbb3-type cytochrome oxidase maturation protein